MFTRGYSSYDLYMHLYN